MLTDVMISFMANNLESDREMAEYAAIAIVKSGEELSRTEFLEIRDILLDGADANCIKTLMQLCARVEGGRVDTSNWLVEMVKTPNLKLFSIPLLAEMVRRSCERKPSDILLSYLEDIDLSELDKETVSYLYSIYPTLMTRLLGDGSSVEHAVRISWKNFRAMNRILFPMLLKSELDGDYKKVEEMYKALANMKTQPSHDVSTYLCEHIEEKALNGQLTASQVKLLARLALWKPAAVRMLRENSGLYWDAILELQVLIEKEEDVPLMMDEIRSMYDYLVDAHMGLDTWSQVTFAATRFGCRDGMVKLLEKCAGTPEAKRIVLCLASMN